MIFACAHFLRAKCPCGRFTKVESCAGSYRRGISPCATAKLSLALLAATCLAAPAAAAPADAPNPMFTGRDLFDLTAAADPQISPDGRQIAYVRRANDIMTDRAVSSIWLIDVATGAQRPLVTDRQRVEPALVARRPPPRLCQGRRRGAAALRPLDGQRRQRQGHRPARQPQRDQLVADRPPDRLSDDRSRRRPAARQGAGQARGRQTGPSRCRSSTRSPTAPTAPAI